MCNDQYTKPVQTRSGPVCGLKKNNICVFLGIPYAAPPVGALRFKAPADVVPWTEPLMADHYADKCHQLNPTGIRRPERDPDDPADARFFAVRRVDTGNMEDIGPYSEDCLYLNVWTPSVKEKDGTRPVLFWIHGGGFSTGSGEAEWFDGSRMASLHNAVVVTVNHRLNVFGFFDLGCVCPDEFPDAANAGLLDIIAALKWVQNNISMFGGDPSKVMIFGESGGGGKVNTLLSMPPAKGLFKRAISMSGPTIFTWEGKTRQVTEAMLAAFDLTPETAYKLQDVPAEELLKAAQDIQIPEFGLRFVPVVDGKNVAVEPTSPESWKINPDVEYMIGTTHDDSRLWIVDYDKDVEFDEPELKKRLIGLGFDAAKIGQTIETAKENYEPAVTPGNLYYSLLEEIYFRYAARKIGDIRSDAGCKVYFYQFDRETPNPDCKAAHGAELPFFFDNLAKAPYVAAADDLECAALADQIASSVANFAATGDPNGGGLSKWEPYNAKEKPIMVIGNHGICRMVNDHLSGIRKAAEYFTKPFGLP